MIRGVHTMFYTSEPEALRAFLRDKLGFTGVDVGDGWLIFDLPEAEMGCHPAEAGDGRPPGTHDISFYCDDIEQTVAVNHLTNQPKRMSPSEVNHTQTARVATPPRPST